jgi:hypothetical protein
VTELPHNEKRLRAFLVGDLAEDARRAIEREALSEDGALFAEIEALDDELRFDYLRGHLSASERECFEQRYLRSAHDRNRLGFADALLQRAASPIVSAVPAGAPAARRSPYPGWRAAFITAAVILTAVSVFEAITTRRLARDLAALRADIAQVLAGMQDLSSDTARVLLR